MFLHLALVHNGELSGAGDKQGKHVAALMLGVLAVKVLPVVLEDALDAEAVNQLVHTGGVHARTLRHLGKRLGHTHLHVLDELGLFLAHDGREAPVLRI